MYDREINGNLLAEVHAISHKVIQKLELWAKRGQGGNWETDSNSCSQNMAFAVLGISIFGEGYVDWAEARKFEKLLVSIADEIPGWIRYTMPPVWRLSFIRFWRKCDQLKHLTESLVTEAQKVQSKSHQTDNPNDTDSTTSKNKRSKGSLNGKYKNKRGLWDYRCCDIKSGEQKDSGRGTSWSNDVSWWIHNCWNSKWCAYSACSSSRDPSKGMLSRD
jgi:hypothetical protein